MADQVHDDAHAILAVMAGRPDSDYFADEFMDATDFSSGRLYVALRWLERLAFITSAWENLDHGVIKRETRRYYRLTKTGRDEVKMLLKRARALQFVQEYAKITGLKLDGE